MLVPLQKPLDSVEPLAALDLLSGGKLDFGTGIGYWDVDLKVFGVLCDGLGPCSEECLTAIRCPRAEDFLAIKGAAFELDHANRTVKSLQTPTLAIWVGANADIAIRRAAGIGNCCYIKPYNTLATALRRHDGFHQPCQ